jgi:hypothetical protein
VGLYLTIFDGDEELDGVEVGSYEDFGAFRDSVTTVAENGNCGDVCPVLIYHSDCDGQWVAEDSAALLKELQIIEARFRNAPPIELNSDWKKEVARTHGLRLVSLYDCFFDIDGEPLVERIRGLAQRSSMHNVPILFQ